MATLGSGRFPAWATRLLRHGGGRCTGSAAAAAVNADFPSFAHHGQLPLHQSAASFARDGFLAPLPLLQPAALRELRACIDDAEQHKFDGRLPPQWVNAALEYEPIWRLVVKNERLLEVASLIFGSDDILHFGTTVFTKRPLDPNASDPPKRVGYHQDLLNWNLTPGKVFTCWLAVDDVDVENGCLHVVPGSHSRGLLEHSTNYDPSNVLMAYQDIDPVLFGGLEAAVPLPLPAGSASLHNGYMVHGSPPNRSATRRRCGVAVHFIPDEVHVGPNLYTGEGMNTETVTEDDWRKPIVVRGKSGRTGLHPQPF